MDKSTEANFDDLVIQIPVVVVAKLVLCKIQESRVMLLALTVKFRVSLYSMSMSPLSRLIRDEETNERRSAKEVIINDGNQLFIRLRSGLAERRARVINVRGHNRAQRNSPGRRRAKLLNKERSPRVSRCWKPVKMYKRKREHTVKATRNIPRYRDLSRIVHSIPK